ncbi:histidine kinase, partial [Actinomadura sp. NPDC048021]
RIADPPDFNLQSSVQLGLFVVSKLAERYNLQVSLKRSAYGGTTAVVVIPRELIVEQGPAPVEAGTTTTNGLEVRHPTTVSVTASARRSTTTMFPPAEPALVAPEAPTAEPSAPHDDVPAGSETIEPEDQSPVLDISTTPSGLPVRVPQANLADPLRTDEPAVADEQDKPDDPGSSPEEIQQIMNP